MPAVAQRAEEGLVIFSAIPSRGIGEIFILIISGFIPFVFILESLDPSGKLSVLSSVVPEYFCSCCS